MPSKPRRQYSQLSQVPQPLPDNEPAADPPQSSARAAAVVRESAPARSTPAATTIRLRPAAAEPLNEAWLNERRRNDPKLSYPEFASMIVRLGLAAYEEQQAAD